ALLGAVEHAHARGVIMRRIVPTTLMVEISGRAVITDLRYADWCLALVPAEERGAGGAFVAPEVRAGEAGEPASDVYTVAAIVYYALTGQEPDPDPARFVPARRVRPAVPAVLDRVLLRALQARPGDRYFTATEMLEDFVSDAGVFHEPAAAPQVAEAGFERRLRRALGDDYELLEEIGAGGFGRVFRARDLGLEREVAIKVLHPSLTADLGVVERFRREAQLAAKLRHPNVVSIYDIMGRAGLQWYTMELVPGANLAQLVERQGVLRAARPAAVRRSDARVDSRAANHGRSAPAARVARRSAAGARRGAAEGDAGRAGGPVRHRPGVPPGGPAGPGLPAAA